MLPGALVGLVACGGKKQLAGTSGRTGDSPARTAPKAYPVLTVAVGKATLYADFPAVIQGVQNIEIRPQVTGYLQTIYVDEGATVTRGQRLFQISAPQYTQDVLTAKAGIRTAQANVSAALLAVNKVIPLVEKDIISHYELDAARYTLATQQAALAQARSLLANANTNLGYTTLVSPLNGVIGTIPYRIGSLVTPITNPLTTVSAISRVYAYFSVNETQLLDFIRNVGGATLQAKLARLPPVQLVLPDGTLYQPAGRIETVIGQVDTQTGAGSFRAAFPNPQQLLRSGNSGTVRVPRPVDSALVIPQSAASDLQNKHFVLVVGKNNVVKSTAITVTPTPDGQSYIVRTGLRTGDRVVLNGGTGLRDGTQIIPRPVKAGPATLPASQPPVTDTTTVL